VARYAAAHAMSADVAMFATVAALIGWLEAEERKQERERLDAADGAATKRTEDRTDGDHDDRTDR
jgi:hypothetical protein